MTEQAVLIKEIETLPARYAAEVLDFVSRLKKKSEPTAEELAAAHAALEAGEPCPLCAKYADPETGELRPNAETIAAIEEGRAMMRGEIPTKRYTSFEEFWADLMSDDED